MSRNIQQLFDLTGKTALVTGGSRGLGLQMAHALGEAGAKIMLSARKAEDLEQATAELQAAGIDARWIAADCGKEEDTRRLADETLQRMGAVDILVNNAGASWGAPAEEHPVAAWDKVMNLNVRGYFILSQQIANSYMIPKKRGRIINISSIAGLNGNPVGMKTLAYNTSKTAVLGFTQTLAAEWGRYGINVNAICPGFFRTKLASGLIDQLGEEHMKAGVPLQRLGDEEDLKGIALLYASDAGKHITGQWMAVDGGVSVVLGGGMSIPYGTPVPFINHLGMTLERFENGQSEMHFTARPEHLNTHEATHGGACMTLLDVAMAAAARSLETDMGVVTIEMKTSFMRPAKGALVATGQVMHRTGRMAFVEGRIQDAQGGICAHATATFKYVPRSPTTHIIPTD